MDGHLSGNQSTNSEMDSDDNAGVVSVAGHGDSELVSCVGYGVVV